MPRGQRAALLGSSEFRFVWVTLGFQAMSYEITESRASHEWQAKEFWQIPSKMELLLPQLVPGPAGCCVPGSGSGGCPGWQGLRLSEHPAVPPV